MVKSCIHNMRKFHFHKLRILFPLLGIISLFSICYFYIYKVKLIYVKDQSIFRNEIEANVKKYELYYKNARSAHLACVQPRVRKDVFVLNNLLSNKETLICDEGEDWVFIDGSEASISEKARKDNGKIECQFTELIRVDDGKTKEGRPYSSSNTFIFSSSDFYSINCTAQNGKTWKTTLAGIRKDETLRLARGWEFVSNDAVKMNVLMLGFDSLSHGSFIRTLPRTYKFLSEELNAIVLDGYNIIGDGTPQALIPILTGKTEFELPEARRRMGNEADFVNSYPFIWKDFERNGYITMFAEDQPHEGIFTYRLKGFKATPTDHYMRPFFTYLYPHYQEHSNYCFYSSPRHKVFLKYVTDFFKVYSDKPRFGFAMHSELSHNDVNLIGIADIDIQQSLSYLFEQGFLTDTILIVFSDHGNRFSAMRSTQQGKQEERLPFFSIVLPRKFKELYPSAADNVRVNSGRLSSPFDIYETLKDLTKFSGAKLGKVSERAISLFSEIPPSRTCKHAFIEPHWCACLTWETISTTEDKVVQAASALVHYINSYTAPQRGLCHEIKVFTISSASLLLPNQGLMNFRQSADYDGFLPAYDDHVAITEEVYQISIKTVPTNDYFHSSDALPLFEASLTYNIKQDSFTVKMDDVSRINKYGDQAHCVKKHLPHLRKFCYCLKPL